MGTAVRAARLPGVGGAPRRGRSAPAVPRSPARPPRSRRPHALRRHQRRADVRCRGKVPRLPRGRPRHHRANGSGGRASRVARALCAHLQRQPQPDADQPHRRSPRGRGERRVVRILRAHARRGRGPHARSARRAGRAGRPRAHRRAAARARRGAQLRAARSRAGRRGPRGAALGRAGRSRRRALRDLDVHRRHRPQPGTHRAARIARAPGAHVPRQPATDRDLGHRGRRGGRRERRVGADLRLLAGRDPRPELRRARPVGRSRLAPPAARGAALERGGAQLRDALAQGLGRDRPCPLLGRRRRSRRVTGAALDRSRHHRAQQRRAAAPRIGGAVHQDLPHEPGAGGARPARRRDEPRGQRRLGEVVRLGARRGGGQVLDRAGDLVPSGRSRGVRPHAPNRRRRAQHGMPPAEALRRDRGRPALVRPARCSVARPAPSPR